MNLLVRSAAFYSSRAAVSPESQELANRDISNKPFRMIAVGFEESVPAKGLTIDSGF